MKGLLLGCDLRAWPAAAGAAVALVTAVEGEHANTGRVAGCCTTAETPDLGALTSCGRLCGNVTHPAVTCSGHARLDCVHDAVPPPRARRACASQCDFMVLQLDAALRSARPGSALSTRSALVLQARTPMPRATGPLSPTC